MTTNKLLPYGLTLIRVIVGIVFLAHGSQKLFTYGIGGVAAGMGQIGLPLPYVSATLVTLTEFLGGLALILGLGTRLAAAPLAFAMLVATTVAHGAGGFFLPTGFEYALTLLTLNARADPDGPGRVRARQRDRRDERAADAGRLRSRSAPAASIA